VADPRTVRPPAKPAAPTSTTSTTSTTAPGDAGERLAELNDHLGRFLEHADQLLDEWARFGAQVRTSVDAELGRIDHAVDGAVAGAAERAGRELAARLDAQVAQRVDRSLGEGVARLRTELDRLANTAKAIGAGQARRPDLGRWTLIAAISANALVAVVLAVVLLRGGGPEAPAAALPVAIDAGAPAVATDPAVDRACAALVAGWSADAAATVARAGTAACGPAADTVADRLAEQWAPPIDAGVPDAGPPDPAPKRPARKAKGKSK
jgi:hypothetical protein